MGRDLCARFKIAQIWQGIRSAGYFTHLCSTGVENFGVVSLALEFGHLAGVVELKICVCAEFIDPKDLSQSSVRTLVQAFQTMGSKNDVHTK